MISDDSDLGSQLSSMRSEVFGDYGFDDAKDKSPQKKSGKDAPSPRMLSMDDINSPYSRRMESGRRSLKEPLGIPIKEKHLSRAVVETEQMGLRLSEEIQRLRQELQKSREHQSELTVQLRRSKAENDDLRDENADLKAECKRFTNSHEELNSENAKLRHELVGNR